jgi:hypothetical protein
MSGNHLSRVKRYWHLWRTLPSAERNLRASRVVERLLRRHSSVRRLGIAPDHPRWNRFRRALRIDLRRLADTLRRDDPARGPLHVNLRSRAQRLSALHPEWADQVIRKSLAVLEHRFDLLGSGEFRPVRRDGSIDWHLDWKSGARWDPEIHHLDLPIVRGDGSDIKVPWELSRFQHLLVLGQAFCLAPVRLADDQAAEIRRRLAVEARSEIDDWIRSNPRGLGIHWACSMEVAIRAVNWLAAYSMMRSAPEWDDEFVHRFVRSLWVHGRHLRRHLEVGAGGLKTNHYLADVLGLFALGCALPELREAESWKRFGWRALLQEMETQVHPDGADFERSAPYHRLAAEMLVYAGVLARCHGVEIPSEFSDRLALMLEFTASYTRPDGSAPQWGDNDDGRLLPLDGYASHAPHDHRHLLGLGGALLSRADLFVAAGPRPVDALWLLDGLPELGSAPVAGAGSRAFSAAGYYVMRDADLHAAIPCGPVGSRGSGNHTHNDLLSVCVWAAGVEWITDPGTGTYSGNVALRNRLRSTSAHATLQLGEREQNMLGHDVDGLFRIAERAHPRVVSWRSDRAGAELVARHSGFGGKDGPWTHERCVRFDAQLRTWFIIDRLEPGSREPRLDLAESVWLRFPVPGSIAVEIVSDSGRWPRQLLEPLDRSDRLLTAIRLSSGETRHFWIGLDLPADSRADLRDGVYSTRYGIVEGCTYVTATFAVRGPVLARSVLRCPEPGNDR